MAAMSSSSKYIRIAVTSWRCAASSFVIITTINASYPSCAADWFPTARMSRLLQLELRCHLLVGGVRGTSTRQSPESGTKFIVLAHPLGELSQDQANRYVYRDDARSGTVLQKIVKAFTHHGPYPFARLLDHRNPTAGQPSTPTTTTVARTIGHISLTLPLEVVLTATLPLVRRRSSLGRASRYR